MSAKKKFDYDGSDFYDAIGNLASRDYNDNEIALHIGEEIRAIIKKRNDAAIDIAIDNGLEELPEPEEYEDIPDSIAAESFSRMKNGKYEKWTEQENKLRSMLIGQVLLRARTRLSLVYKGVYDKMALGKWQTKTETTTTSERMGKDGEMYTETVTTKSVQELAPNMQALTVWRFHHDPEFRKQMTALKRMDIAVEDKNIDKINVSVTYNKKEDLDLQGDK